jgi:hypothetical protein
MLRKTDVPSGGYTGANDGKFVLGKSQREESVAIFCHYKQILDVIKAVIWINKNWLNIDHHARFEFGLVAWPQHGIFMQLDTKRMSNMGHVKR